VVATREHRDLGSSDLTLPGDGADSHQRPRALERYLFDQLALVEHRIADLEGERAALEQLTINFSLGETPDMAAPGSKHLGKVLVESAIINRLEEAFGQPVAVKQLWVAASAARPGIMPSTFRSHLHRMKSAGCISSPRYGFWQLITSEPTPDP
jgi:hypothetical protein